MSVVFTLDIEIINCFRKFQKAVHDNVTSRKCRRRDAATLSAAAAARRSVMTGHGGVSKNVGGGGSGGAHAWNVTVGTMFMTGSDFETFSCQTLYRWLKSQATEIVHYAVHQLRDVTECIVSMPF